MNIKDTKIILASGSPRRIEMMKKEGAEPLIVKPSCREDIHTKLTPEETVMALALRKNLDVRSSMGDELFHGNFTVVSADTIVALGDEIYGKPVDSEDALRMLKNLSGKVHQVITGVCIYNNVTNHCEVFRDVTDVYVRECSDSDLKAYIATGEPLDKAGAYAIQGGFAPYIDHIDGDYNNVVGFPMDAFKSHFSRF